MREKICLITGASDGIGKATAMGLAKLGAKVVLVCREKRAGQRVLEEIKRKTDNLSLDLSSLESVRKLAEQFKSRYQRLDVLIHNAGTYFTKRKVTKEGPEMTFVVNYLSRFCFPIYYSRH